MLRTATSFHESGAGPARRAAGAATHNVGIVLSFSFFVMARRADGVRARAGASRVLSPGYDIGRCRWKSRYFLPLTTTHKNDRQCGLVSGSSCLLKGKEAVAGPKNSERKSACSTGNEGSCSFLHHIGAGSPELYQQEVSNTRWASVDINGLTPSRVARRDGIDPLPQPPSRAAPRPSSRPQTPVSRSASGLWCVRSRRGRSRNQLIG
ncbi:hypothetical protein EVAR_6178_1 [Eumeta japonica]|uniref:Uncharacterized protein n=1 Tax=Eumeta variegata TaxID=151549 RepID=A0A4C1TED9_EUMVA|nr:hypothetical protein EVAR_6178_1 [Eumeta japonica]